MSVIFCLSLQASQSCTTVLQTKVTPIVEGYGGWAFQLEIVPIESAYPGFGELAVSVKNIYINSINIELTLINQYSQSLCS